MPKLSEKIMEKLKKQKVKHKPKWKFIAKRIYIWSALVVGIILLALAISMIMHQVTVARPIFVEHLRNKEFFPVFGIFPYFWMLISVILLTFVYLDFKKTSTGYRYRTDIIIIASILASIVIGYIIFKVEVSEMLEEQFQMHHFYQMMHFHNDFSKGPGGLRMLIRPASNNLMIFPPN